MKIRHLALALFAVCAFALFANAQAIIDFPRGSGTEVREEAINKRATAWDFQLRAPPGQTATIKLESPARGAVFVLSYETEGDHPVALANNATSWWGRLPKTELEDQHGVATYNLSVSPRARRLRGELRFKLIVTIK